MFTNSSQVQSRLMLLTVLYLMLVWLHHELYLLLGLSQANCTALWCYHWTYDLVISTRVLLGFPGKLKRLNLLISRKLGSECDRLLTGKKLSLLVLLFFTILVSTVKAHKCIELNGMCEFDLRLHSSNRQRYWQENNTVIT